MCVLIRFVLFFARQERRNEHHLIFYLFFSDSALFQVSHGVDSVHTRETRMFFSWNNSFCNISVALFICFHVFLPTLCNFVLFLLSWQYTCPNTPLYHWKQFGYFSFLSFLHRHFKPHWIIVVVFLISVQRAGCSRVCVSSSSLWK